MPPTKPPGMPAIELSKWGVSEKISTIPNGSSQRSGGSVVSAKRVITLLPLPPGPPMFHS